MKHFLPFVFLLAACASTHKIVHTDIKKVDSSSVSQRDTSYESVQVQRSDDLSAKDVDITVWYDTPTLQGDHIPSDLATGRAWYPADSGLAEAKARPVDRSPRKVDQYVDLIQQAITASGRPAKIEIHIGEVSDSSSRVVRVDTGHASQQTQVQVKTEDKKADKDITRSGWPWYAWLIGGIIIFIITLLVLKRLRVI